MRPCQHRVSPPLTSAGATRRSRLTGPPCGRRLPDDQVAVVHDLVDELADLAPCLLERLSSERGRAVVLAHLAADDAVLSFEEAGVFETMEQRIQRSGRQVVSVALQLGGDPRAVDGFLVRVIEQMDLDEAQQEVAE